MDKLIDVHCHLVPYVDDGAETLDQALALLELQARQGVMACFATPHQRKHMFETPQETVEAQFNRLRKEAAQTHGLPILLLGRENHCDSTLYDQLQHSTAITLGGSPYLLMEFSSHHTLEEMEKFLELAIAQGYCPVIAHGERYAAMRQHPHEMERFVKMGAWLQINAGSLLGQEGRAQFQLCRQWLLRGLVHLVASDCHRTDIRTPNLGQAADFLEKKYGKNTAVQLLQANPLMIVSKTTEIRRRIS